MINQNNTIMKRNLFFLRVIFLLFLLELSIFSRADINLPALVSNHMVLQQNTRIRLWGRADPGEVIRISGGWLASQVECTTSDDGTWQTEVKTIEAGGPYKLTLKGKNVIELSDIYLGEVWVCGGQSNMHLPVGKFGEKGDWRTGVDHYKTEIENANYPQIRMFTVKRVASEEMLDDTQGEWVVCSPETAAEFSAVGYFFGRELFNKIDVPIGLLNTSWGGTPAEAWTKKSLLTNDKGFNEIVKRYQYNLDNWDKVWRDYKNVVDSLDALRKAGKDVGGNPRPPVGLGSNKAPYVLYNGMVAPLLNYRIKGVVWYQGENNAQRAWQYRRLFPVMIKNWRDDWYHCNFPFYFVQIAPHRSQNPEIREAQLMTFREVPNTGMVVTTDIGDSINIHPTNKQEVGRRLSLWALAKDYGYKELVFSGPVYKKMKVKGQRAFISFDYADGGLVCKGDSLTHFEIAGTNKEFVPAIAKIEGDQIVVWSDKVRKPVSVRFGWSYFPMHNLYNKAGLPASPFRTDDWPGKTYGKN
jgi:sialate O-acetylesterase